MSNFSKHVGQTLLTNIGMTLIGLLTGLLLARQLGPYGRGLMTTVLIWPQMLAWAAGLSLGHANLYYAASEPKMRLRIFANSLWASLVLGAVVAAVAFTVLPHFIRLNASQVRLMHIGMLLLPLAVWGDFSISLLNGTSRIDRLNIARSLPPFVTLASLAGLAATHHLTVTSAVLATWAGGWASAAATLWFLLQDGNGSVRPDLSLLRRSLAYSSRVHVGTLASLANSRLDQLIMTAIVAPKSLGLYAFAVTLSELLRQVSAALSTVIFPRLAGEADPARRSALAWRAARWALLSGVVLAGVLCLAAPSLVALVWGPRFLPAIPAMRVLLPGTVALCWAGAMCSCLQGAGRPLVGTVAEIVALAVMVPLLLLLLPRIGIFGAGLASTCGYCANCTVVLCCFARTFGASGMRSLRPTRRDWRDVREAFIRP